MLTGLTALFAGLMALAAGQPAYGCGYGMPSPLARFALADCVVVGQVTAVEEQPRTAAPYPGAPQQQEYKIVVVRIQSGLKGAQGLTHVRVALVAPQVWQPGYEACFFLTHHFEEAFFLPGMRYDYPVGKANNPGFDKEVAQYQRWGKLLDDPVAGLKSDNADVRFETAALLITQYRTVPRGVPVRERKLEPIDPAESRLILQALAGIDWSKSVEDFRMTPQRLFSLVGATPQDGWKSQGFKDMKEFETAAKGWLKEHATTFRIAAYVRS
jgi:hypothetical protein